MNGFIVKLISVLLILTLFGSCMTVKPDNRSEAVNELRKKRTVSISKVPLENPVGPCFRINAPSNNAALMVAGQMGMELDYKYFIIIASDKNQFISGYAYQGTGGVSTSIVYSITVAYTNDESLESRYNVYECSSLLDGYTFVTQGGQIVSWTLFGTSFVGGMILMLSAFDVDYPKWNDPNYDSKMREAERRRNGMLTGGYILMGGSILFTIPLFMK